MKLSPLRSSSSLPLLQGTSNTARLRRRSCASSSRRPLAERLSESERAPSRLRVRYHLATDPGELANLVAPRVVARASAAEAALHAAVARRMRLYLAAMLARGAARLAAAPLAARATNGDAPPDGAAVDAMLGVAFEPLRPGERWRTAVEGLRTEHVRAAARASRSRGRAPGMSVLPRPPPP